MMYAIARKDGGVSIMVMVDKDATPEGEIGKWHQDAQSNVASFHPISAADIPQDRSYRNAWTHDGKAVVHDMPKAREIHRDKMRVARAPLLEDLDRQHTRAVGRKKQSEADAIEARREELRNVTDDPRIEAAPTIEKLKAIWPDALKG